tara:strand:- start:38783 stop:39373 length:591 start_codon:yes stop_codon:yes gene_type:complete
MERRKALKTLLSSSVGCALVTPTLLQILISCETKLSIHWEPLFLNTTQAFIVEQLSSVILPKGSNKGAFNVHTAQFIDLLLKDVVSKKEQQLFIKGGTVFQHKFEEQYHKNVEKGTREDFETMLKHYFNKTVPEQKLLLEFVEKEENEVHDNNKYLIYHFLITVRKLTLLGFYTSREMVGKSFNPPSYSYQHCVTM